MARNGKIVITDSGKRGVRTTGKTAVFNTNGECAECCEEQCNMCQAGQTPDILELVLTSMSFCCHFGDVYGQDKLYSDPNGFFSSPITLTRMSDPNRDTCTWYSTFALKVTRTVGTYDPDTNCDGALISEASEDCEIRLWMTSQSSWAFRIQSVLNPVFFDSTITGRQEGDCVTPLVFTNTNTSCRGNNFNTPVASGGTATIQAP